MRRPGRSGCPGRSSSRASSGARPTAASASLHLLFGVLRRPLPAPVPGVRAAGCRAPWSRRGGPPGGTTPLLPVTAIAPSVAGRKPSITASSVDLPAPDGPVTASQRPGSATADRPLKTSSPPGHAADSPPAHIPDGPPPGGPARSKARRRIRPFGAAGRRTRRCGAARHAAPETGAPPSSWPQTAPRAPAAAGRRRRPSAPRRTPASTCGAASDGVASAPAPQAATVIAWPSPSAQADRWAARVAARSSARIGPGPALPRRWRAVPPSRRAPRRCGAGLRNAGAAPCRADIRSASSAAAGAATRLTIAAAQNGRQGRRQQPGRGSGRGRGHCHGCHRRKDHPREQVPDSVDVVDDGAQHVAALQQAPQGQCPPAQRRPESARGA